MSIAAIPAFLAGCAPARKTSVNNAQLSAHRVRPGDPSWPSEASWNRLSREVQGRLTKIESPLNICAIKAQGEACKEVFRKLKNPYYISHQPALTQTSGWVDAWTSAPSVYAVEAEETADVVAAVNFARDHNLRLVVKGGAHSYQGRSSSEDSLLIWTRRMKDVTLHDAFVPQGCDGTLSPQPAVSIGAGAIWMDAYNEVTTKIGRYVQGGGCTTVGVAGDFLWAGDQEQAGHYLYGYRSAWLPASLLEKDQLSAFTDALVACTRYWDVSLHFNKGLAGAPESELVAAKDTAMNPAVLGAFALAIIAGGKPHAFLGIPGHEPDIADARRKSDAINRAMGELLKVVTNPGSYVSESDFFEREWQHSFWGSNYPRLASVKQKYDSTGVFFVHHGVGSEDWSADGFTRLQGG